tara:strand:+ start:188 stop:433 length:246 start_codon:yes stop_codon:yes gene_type:complete
MKDLLISLVLICSIIFSGWNKIEAAIQGWVPPDDYGKGDSMEILINPSEDNEDTELQTNEMSMEDIFGSEQVFPFPPGLGN